MSEQAKNQYLPQDFYRLLQSAHQQLDCLARSENYQDFITSKYAQGLEVNLYDALQAINEVGDAFEEQQLARLKPLL